MTLLPLKPGRKKERLPDGENVIRLLKKTTNDGKVPPDEFELSTLDKQSELQSLSVWAERITSSEQAREFMGEKKEAYSFYCSINIDAIRALRPAPESKEVGSLDVVWHPLTVLQGENEVPDPRPGAEGHAGITGLNRPSGLPKRYFFSLRSQLADFANETLKNISEH